MNFIRHQTKSLIMKKIILLSVISILFLTCKQNKYIPDAGNFKDHMKGMQIRATLLDNSVIEGEILAINELEIYLLSTKKGRINHIIPRKEIKRAKIKIYNKSKTNQLKQLKTISTLNYLSILGHGFVATLSFQINLLVNSIVVGNAAGYNYITYPNNISWREINKFSRFPQGIPAEVWMDDIE